MATPRAKAVYKKKDGILGVSDDQTAVTWTPVPGTSPAVVSLKIDTITNLQQTPDSSPKVMLKIFAKASSEGGEPVAYLFNFISTEDPRAEANTIKDTLSRLLAESRSNGQGLIGNVRTTAGASPEAANGSGGAAGADLDAMSTARYFDDAELRANTELHQSLIKRDRSLRQTFLDARATKPVSMSDAAFNSQFWSSRTNLLRAHAIETNQRKGTYNVLARIKPRLEDGDFKLQITNEQTELIFKQHPLVRHIYDEEMPKIKKPTEMERKAAFWSSFFLSKLCKRLRGERPDDKESEEPLFAKYSLDDSNNAIQTKIAAHRVPHVIDVQGNDEDQGGFKGGNMPDEQMRSDPRRIVAKTLNMLSEKVLAQVAPADPDPERVPTMDDSTYQALAMRDLLGDAEPDRIMLNVREQARFFSNNQDSAPSADARAYEEQDPSMVLDEARADLATLEGGGVGGGNGGGSGIDLHRAIGIDDESDSEDEEARRRAPHVGSREARAAAQAQIWDGLAKRKGEVYEQAEDETSPMGLPAGITQKALVTNATTTEFLRQFWAAFLSGDPDRAQELVSHVEALKKSVQRIEAVAEEAEQERQKVIVQKKEEIVAYWRRTKKKLRWSEDKVLGGRKGVYAVLAPTLNALQLAQDRYQEALAAEGIKPSTED